MLSTTRLPLSQRWSAPALEAITATKMDQHGGYGARAVPFARRQRDAVGPEAERALGRRAARRLEFRQRDFDPAMAAMVGRSMVRSATALACMAGEVPFKCSIQMPAEHALSWRWNTPNAAASG